MIDKPKWTDDQRECLTVAVNLLAPECQAEGERYEIEVGWLVMWHRRQARTPQFKVAREDIDELQKHLKRAATTLERLEPLAYVNLFTPKNLERFREITGFQLLELLTEIVDACPKAHTDIAKKRGGRPYDYAKRNLMLNCKKLFEKHRPNEARPSSPDFLQFCDLVYSVASGETDAHLERAIRWAFTQNGRP